MIKICNDNKNDNSNINVLCNNENLFTLVETASSSKASNLA